jgi:hypothetical protein
MHWTELLHEAQLAVSDPAQFIEVSPVFWPASEPFALT